MKKILAVLLAMVFVLPLFSGFTVMAAEVSITVVADNDSNGNPTWKNATMVEGTMAGKYIVKNIDDGYSFTWKPLENQISVDYTSAKVTEVVIPSKINGVDVLSVSMLCNAQSPLYDLKSVIVSEGIPALGNTAFKGYPSLTDVKLPSTLTSIGDESFANCAALKTVTLPSNLTTIGKASFANCSALETVEIPSSVKTFGTQIFKGSSITHITFPEGVTNPIPNETFANCKQLKHVTFEGYVKSFEWNSFVNTSALETITFKNEKPLASVFDAAFKGSSPDLVVYYPEEYADAYDTYKFKSLFLPGTVFRFIGQGAEFDPPIGTVQDAVVVADNDANGNPSWQTATTTVTNKDDIYILTNTAQNYSFIWLPEIQTLIRDDNSAGAVDVVIPSSINGVEVLTLGENLIPKANPQVMKSIVVSPGPTLTGNSVFAGHQLLEEVKLPSTIYKLGETTFSGCTNLSHIELPEGLKWMGFQSFKDTIINEITFPASFGDNVEGDMFSVCKSLEKVVFKSRIKTLNWATFYKCANLKEIVFLHETPPSKIDSSAFAEASDDFTVYYPKGATGYEEPTFQALFPANVKFKEYPDFFNEITNAVKNEASIDVEYEIEAAEGAEGIGIVALYKGNTLVECKTVDLSSTSTTFEGSFDADTVKLFIWNAETLEQLSDAAVSKVEPPAQRGRVYNANGTVVTAEGNPLRGAFIEIDYSTTDVATSQLAKLKEYGCNAVHLYAERQSADLTAGYNVKRVDNYVEMTERLGLYLVLTPGDSTLNKQFDIDFWNIYAPRYKDKTHVIYEVQNESNGFAPPTEQYLADLKEVHDVIRGHAPDTHILLYSFSHLSSVEDIDHYMETMEIDDWSKTAVAWHGYDTNLAEYRRFFNYLRDNGYASINTEVPATIDNKSNGALLGTLEELGCSWLNFIIASRVPEDDCWKTPIEKSGIFWNSDFGMWPEQNIISAHNITKASAATLTGEGYIGFEKYIFATAPATVNVYVTAESEGSIDIYVDSLSNAPIATVEISGGNTKYSAPVTATTGKHTLYIVINGDVALDEFCFLDPTRNPYERIEMENYDEHLGIDMGPTTDVGGGMAIGAIHENDYVAFENVDFDDGATYCEIRTTGPYTTSTAQLRLDSLDGPIIGEIELPITGGWENYTTVSADISGATGIHKLYVVFINGHHGGGYANINWLQFYK